MTALTVAYTIVWLGLGLYVLRLHARQRRIQRMIAALQLQFEQLGSVLPTNGADPDSKAA